jgi:hypothetical protein
MMTRNYDANKDRLACIRVQTGYTPRKTRDIAKNINYQYNYNDIKHVTRFHVKYLS